MYEVETMVALSFKVFKDKLVSREKQQTIRPINIPRIEQMKRLGIQIYWKQRNPKESEKLYNAKLKSFMYIKFDKKGYPRYRVITDDPFGPLEIEPKLSELTLEEQKELAKRDGFGSINEMAKWFLNEYGENLTTTPFLGAPEYFMVIQWEEV